MTERLANGQFPPGASGNPGGRPKEDPEFRRVAKAHAVEAVERLVEWIRSDNAKASVAASVALLNRAYGMPKQEIEHTGEEGGALVVKVIRFGDTAPE